MKIAIVLADDHELVRKSLAALLDNEPDLAVVGECANGRELVEMVARLSPSVAVVDIAMPELNGMDAARRLKEVAPATRVIMLSRHTDQAYVSAALDAGVVGYVVKSGVVRDLLDAVRTASRGKIYLSEEVVGARADIMRRRRFSDAESGAGREQQPQSQHFIYTGVERRSHADAGVDCPLSPREREVLQLIAEGRGPKSIAAALGITEQTVKSHRKNIVAKLDIRDTASLTRYAIRIGLIRSW